MEEAAVTPGATSGEFVVVSMEPLRKGRGRAACPIVIPGLAHQQCLLSDAE